MSTDDFPMSHDAGSTPVEPEANDVNKFFFTMLQNDTTMLEQFKTLFGLK